MAERLNSVPNPYIRPRLADRKLGGAESETEGAGKQEVSEVVRRAKEGSRDAFGALYHLYYAALFRLARFHLRHQAAEDAVAETFLRAWVALPRYRETGAPFVSWLYGIARHVIYDAAAGERRVDPREHVPDRVVDPNTGIDDRILLAEAIRRLPERQRQVIEMKFILGLRNEQVAGVLNKSPGAVNAQQWRALEALKRFLEIR